MAVVKAVALGAWPLKLTIPGCFTPAICSLLLHPAEHFIFLYWGIE
jgi:hypothetical protein